jgi:hypothetical protein
VSKKWKWNYSQRNLFWNFDDRRRCCILFLDRTAAEQIFNFQTWKATLSAFQWFLKLKKSRIPFRKATLSAFRWSIKRTQPVSVLWATAVGNSTRRWNNISGRSYHPVQNRFLAKFHHDLPRKFAYKKCRQRTQLSAGYSYDSFWYTVRLLWHFEVLL